MKRKQIAVCDEERDYTLRFAEYAGRHGNPLFVVHGFTGLEEFLEDTKEHPADIVLLSKKYTKDLKKEEYPGQIICLSEEEYQEEEPE